MKKSLRLSEVWFRRGLWLVALIFAFFLLGLGRTIIGDLPKVEHDISPMTYIDQARYQQLDQQVKVSEAQNQTAQSALEQLNLQLNTAQNDVTSAEKSFNDWLQTRSATEQNAQNPAVIARAQQLQPLRQKVRDVQAKIEQQQQVINNADQAAATARDAQQKLLDAAQPQVDREISRQELRVFAYRLTLTLPLLLIAAYLWKRRRQSRYWPFVWGFIIFALVTFFVELVPYLPSYGGYVRYIVGIGVTLLIGRQAIISLNAYLERQKQAEALPEQLRRQELSYDVALKRLSAGVCPGCERGINLTDPTLDYCPHCGIGLHDHCRVCDARKSTFVQFCQVCGTPASRPDTVQPLS